MLSGLDIRSIYLLLYRKNKKYEEDFRNYHRYYIIFYQQPCAKKPSRGDNYRIRQLIQFLGEKCYGLFRSRVLSERIG